MVAAFVRPVDRYRDGSRTERVSAVDKVAVVGKRQVQQGVRMELKLAREGTAYPRFNLHRQAVQQDLEEGATEGRPGPPEIKVRGITDDELEHLGLGSPRRQERDRDE